MTQSIFIGIDTGTQGTKVIAFDRAEGRVVAGAHSGYAVEEDAHGSREQSPQLWLDAIRACFREIFAIVNPATVRAVGVSGQQHGCVALDAAGNVLRPAKLWCDTSTVAECGEILERAGGKANVLAITGSDLAVGFTASKILHLKKNHPDLWQRLATLFLPHD
ncbi:MAG: FGGY family carbohydrate kinase, partial [Kiritimatiellaeota bacterium]|nr:FGGY family carbohydrate kinase [Kiritimatiellota bacterium]